MTEKKAYAKINLAREVLGRRGDGYHEVSTVLHAVGLADHLTFEESEGLSLECDDPAIASEGNLVLRAARLLQQTAGSSRGAS
ncbi:MAG: 4-(cytidine 5'-diphospho)-2-C-methyl-D-erythritol kinase, partial [Chloroflexi bacterium]|nr:4-(cytidine 5'-diphospho)-2-C-methyl-D-erythritol kinase [Chloroflexota bacterium]